MRIFKKIEKMFSPTVNFHQPEEVSPAEQLLGSNTAWPMKIVGTLHIIDAGSIDNEGFPHWTIGQFEIEGVDGSILVEFQGESLKNAGITEEFEYGDPLVLFVNPAKEEYYQVESVGN